MTREEAKKYLALIQAFAEGGVIETYNPSANVWEETDEPQFCEYYNYRVKPEPKFRPFKDRNECWEVMLCHKPFGWVLDKEHNERFNINSIGETGVGGYTYRVAFEALSFADGTPFGVEE